MVFKNLTEDDKYKVTKGIYKGWEIKRTSEKGLSTYVISSSTKSAFGEGIIQMEFKQSGALTEDNITDHMLGIIAKDLLVDGFTSANLDILTAIPAEVMATSTFKTKVMEQFVSTAQKANKTNFSDELQYVLDYADKYKKSASKREAPSVKKDASINL